MRTPKKVASKKKMAAEPPPMDDDLFADVKEVIHEDSHQPSGSRMEEVVLSNPPASLDVEHNTAAPTLRTTDDNRSVPVVAPMRSFEQLGNRAENTMRSADEVSSCYEVSVSSFWGFSL